MSLRLASLCLSPSLLLASALAGCAEAPQARFADASPAQLERALRAASGHDLVSALVLGIALSGKHQPTECPAIVTAGQDTTVTGGCTRENGTRLEGTIAIHNLPSWEDDSEYDPSKPGSVELDFRIVFPQHDEIVLDGRVELLEEPEQRISGALTLDTEGIASTSRLDFGCEDGACDMAPGAEIEISELGRPASSSR